MRTRYTVEITYEDKPSDVIPLTARNDRSAMRQCREYIPRKDGGKVFLHFYRSGFGGGGEGYLDASGNACYPGREWR